MTIVRTRQSSNFTRIPNSIYKQLTLHYSDGTTRQLSWDARALLGYLLTLPSDWKIKVPHLVKLGIGGRDKIYALLRELVDFGFAERIEVRDERGRVSGTETVVYDVPDVSRGNNAAAATARRVANGATLSSPAAAAADHPSSEASFGQKVAGMKDKLSAEQMASLVDTHSAALQAARPARPAKNSTGKSPDAAKEEPGYRTSQGYLSTSALLSSRSEADRVTSVKHLVRQLRLKITDKGGRKYIAALEGWLLLKLPALTSPGLYLNRYVSDPELRELLALHSACRALVDKGFFQ